MADLGAMTVGGDPADDTPLWATVLSCALWLVIFVAIVMTARHAIAAKQAEKVADGRRVMQQAQICRRFAQDPRPNWPQCRNRAESGWPRLLAPQTPGQDEPASALPEV